MRIVSLIASSTEMVCALGFEKDLVGRSHECDFPESVKRLPSCTEPKFNITGTSYEIDQRLKAILQEGLGVYRVDAKALDNLRPDLIITQTQCEVCAVSLKDVEAAVCELIASKPKLISLHPNSLADIWTDIERVAVALQAPERGAALISALQSRMRLIAEMTARLHTPKPRVAYIEWIDPLMAGGNWMPELVAMAGGVNLFGEAGRHSPFMKWEELVAADPDVLFVSPCGFDLGRTLDEMRWLVDRTEWLGLRAVKSKRVFLADGNQYFNRPGPRVVEALEVLAETLHPEVFKFGHEGRGWITSL